MKKKIIYVIIAIFIISQTHVVAMSTKDFDDAMAKGIDYYNRGLYYEAKDEFQWFKEYNYNNINSGQGKYLNDYINSTNIKIGDWERRLRTKLILNDNYFNKFRILKLFIEENNCLLDSKERCEYRESLTNGEIIITYSKNDDNIIFIVKGETKSGIFDINVSLRESYGTLHLYQKNLPMSSEGYFDVSGRYHTTYTDMIVSHEEINTTFNSALKLIDVVLKNATYSPNSYFTVSLSDFNIYY